MSMRRLLLPALAVATALILAGCPGPEIRKIDPDPFAQSKASPSPAAIMVEPRPDADVAPRAFLPAPSQRIPRDAQTLAEELQTTTLALRDSVESWRSHGDISTYPPPENVQLLALYQQRIYRVLGQDSKLATRTIARLPQRLQGEARANASAAANLFSLVTPVSGSPDSPPPTLSRRAGC